MSNNFTFGSDPEFFVQTMDGKLISPRVTGCTGTKAEPTASPFPSLKWQVDGLALEFNTPGCDLYFGSVADKIYNAFYSEVPGKDGKYYRLSNKVCHVFTPEEVQESAKQDFELGCSPDFDAWLDGKQNPPPKPDKPLFRTTSGHISIGFPTMLNEALKGSYRIKFMSTFVRALEDTFTSLCKLLGVKETEEELKRRKLYGRPGSFREKPFGLEWRTLSNRWVWDKSYGRVVEMALYGVTQRGKFEDYLKKEHVMNGFKEVHDEVISLLEAGK